MILARPSSFRAFRTTFTAFLATAVPLSLNAQQPQAALDQLMAAEKAYAAAAEKSPLTDALAAMFADSVTMPLPGGRFARTREEARAALAANPVNQGAHITWHAVRGGISADGIHGFTAGFMTLKTDTASIPLKYIAYWVKGTDGWRVAAYKRAPAAAFPPPTALPSLLPAAMTAPSPGATAGHLRTLVSAEKQFSDSSQKVGLGPAFAVFGRDDAMNMGGPQAVGFVIGAKQIAKVVGGGPPDTPSPVYWSADFALVASSGDLGVTFGLIKRNDPSAAGPPAAFFTIWARPGAKGEWRYIAE